MWRGQWRGRGDPYGGGPYGGGPYGGGYGGPPGYGGYGRGGNNCMRDACLLESGCCIAEALTGNCAVVVLLAAWRSALSLFTPGRRPASRERSGLAGLLLAAVRKYQREVSPRRAQPCCRFSPTCSEYAAQALIRHGAWRGSLLAAGRLLRCRPYGRRGDDPVPA